jgi:hypothetical protein
LTSFNKFTFNADEDESVELLRDETPKPAESDEDDDDGKKPKN